MTFKIHFEMADGSDDAFIVTGDTFIEIQEKAEAELTKRGGRNPWSEEVP